MPNYLRLVGMLYDKATSIVFHQHIPTLKEAEDFNRARKKTSAKKKLALENANALEKHMLTFSDENGEINAISIYVSLIYDWHLPDVDAKNLAEAVMQAAFYEGVPGVYMTATGISGRFLPRDARSILPHPFDLGNYNKRDGSFNKIQFERLEKYSTNINNKFWISRAGIEAFNKDWQRIDVRWEDADFVSQKIGQLAHPGEFDLFFRQATSCRIDGVDHVSLQELKEFYIDSAGTVAKIKEGILPSHEPCIPSSIGGSSKTILEQLQNTVTGYVANVVENCPSYFPPDKPTYWQHGATQYPPLFVNSTTECLPVRPLAIGGPQP